jgi:predicted dehydrogenase
MRFAVIGCGVIGKHHAASIARLGQRAELVLAVDEVAEPAHKLAAEYGIESVTSVNEALARPDIDAVAVCTPSGRHADLVIAALEAGKHVVVEKPLDVSVEAAQRVQVAQERTGRTVTVISQHRFDPSSQLVHQAIRDGKFGRITSGSASIVWWRSQGYYDSGDWRGTWSLDGGGALMNQGIHTIDLLVWMLGQPVEVFAWTECLAHDRIEVEDTAMATIRFAGGALGVVHGTTAAYPGLTARLGVYGDRGSAVIDNDVLEYFHVAKADAADLAYGGAGDGNQAADVLQADRDDAPGAGADPAALSDAHTDQYRDFLDAVAEGRPPLVTVAEASRTLAVVCAIYESARTGLPVRVTGHDLAPEAGTEQVEVRSR